MKNKLWLLLACLPFFALTQDAELGLNLGHTEAITGIRFSPDGKYLLSSSADKTMKLWDVRSGKLLQTSPVVSDDPFMRHLFVFPEKGLATYSTESAISNWYNWIWNTQNNSLRDGSSLMAKPMDSMLMLGEDETPAVPSPEYEQDLKNILRTRFSDNGQPIYFTNGVGVEHYGLYTDGIHYYQRSGDQLTFYGIWEEKNYQPNTYPGLTPIFSFSSNGQYLFGSPDGPAGREFTIWQLQGGAIHTTLSLPADTYFNDVSPDGRFVLLTDSRGQSSLYDISQQQLLPIFKRFPPTNLLAPDSPVNELVFNQATFSPDGQWIARGGKNGAIYLHHYPTGKLKTVLKGHTEDLQSARFSADGRLIRFQIGDGSQRTWDLATGIVKRSEAVPSTSSGRQPTAMIGISDDGQLAIKGENTLELWDIKANRKIVDINGGQDITAPGHQVKSAVFSPDKKRILFLTTLVARRAQVSHTLWDLENNRKITDISMAATNGITHATFSPDGKFLALGRSGGNISVFEPANGKNVCEFDGHEDAVNHLAFSPANSHYLLSMSTARDGAVKLWDIEKQVNMASLINLQDQNWVVINDAGLFDASPQAMELLFYKVKQENITEIIELEQLKSRYYEPGLLQKVTGYASERIRSVEGLKQVALYPELNAQIEKDQLKILLQERSGGIGPLSIFVNGKEVAKDANPQRQTSISYDLRPVQNFLFRHPDSTNTVSLRVYNQDGWLKSGALTLTYKPTAWTRGTGGNGASWQAKLDPKMYVVSIGTSDYTGTQLDLQYATQDATAMAKAMQAVGANLFANGDSIEVYALTTAKTGATGLEGTAIQWQFASKENVKATLNAIKQKAKAEDILLVYLSGHGLTYGGAEQSQFYYLTGSVANEGMISDKEVREKYTISSGELTEWINDIAALKQVLVVDACNSGKVVENLTGNTRALNSSQIRALDRMKDRTGMFILSGSAADKVSYEASEYGQGLLTYALLQGMVGVATRKTADGDYVDVMKLFQYARDEVPRLAASINGIQTPMLGFPTSGASFDIGIVKDQSSIPIGRKKSVIIRSVFLNQNSLDDDLGLIQLLEKEFREETEEGVGADLIYVDANEYPGAYSVKGLYTKAGGVINVKLKLFGGAQPMELDIKPTEDPKKLVRYIVREVKKKLSAAR